MNFCPKCRKKLVVQDFCVECGADLTEYLNGAPSVDSSIDTFDFSVLHNANEQLIEQSGLVVENDVLTGYTGKKTSVYIPSSVDGIFDRVFYNNDVLTEVIIENGVSFIGKYAFAGCRYLKKIKIPKSVNQIGECAFYGTQLDYLTLDEYNEAVVKACLSVNALNYLNAGANPRDFIKNENGSIVANIRELEGKAIEYFNERKRKEQEERERHRREEARKRELILADIGKIWTFGSYYINSGSRKEPIEWIVVARQEGRAMLVTKDAIAYKKYNEANASCYYANCTLRKWLVNDFFGEAFSSSEKARMLTLKEAGENASFNITSYRYGGVENDKIFLLSKDNVCTYLKTPEQRQCKTTPYALNNGQYCYSWWLDSYAYQGSFGNSYYANIVRHDGATSLVINNGGYTITFENGVRPAIWINV